MPQVICGGRDGMPGPRTIKGPDGNDYEAELVGFRSSGEHFNEYLLDDGTVLKLKLVLTEALRIKDLYDGQGNPVYYLQHSQVTSTDCPDNLKRGNDG
jgi:hypothetical protein